MRYDIEDPNFCIDNKDLHENDNSLIDGRILYGQFSIRDKKMTVSKSNLFLISDSNTILLLCW